MIGLSRRDYDRRSKLRHALRISGLAQHTLRLVAERKEPAALSRAVLGDSSVQRGRYVLGLYL